jgi:glycerol-3-phosphate acyltransferase PlsX
VLFLDVGGNSDMCTVKDIGPPPDPTDVGAVRHYFDKLVSIYMPGKQYEKNARDMVHFARLGSLYMEILRGVARPRVGLFNIGVEEGKGNRFIHICHELLQQEKRTAGLNYVGFAEPEAIEETDVIVIDGFTGNSVLKGIEKAVTLVKSTIKRSLVGKLVSCFSRTKTDPSDYSGAYLLGLRDIIVKIHGDAKAKGFATAYRKAREFAQPTRFNRQSYSNLSAAIEAAYAARYAEK